MRYATTVAMVGVMAVVFGVCASGVQAQTVRAWDAGGDGTDWFDPNNWTPDGTPLPSDTLTVTFGEVATGQDVHVVEDGSLAISGSGTTVDFANKMGIGISASWDASPGAVTVSDGAVLSADLLFLFRMGSLTLDGSTLALTRPVGTNTFQAVLPTISNGGRIDLRASRLLVDYASEPTAGDGLYNQIEAWLADGTIYSSLMDTEGSGSGTQIYPPIVLPSQRAIGYIPDKINMNIRVASTVPGDADCNFRVDLDDLTLLGTFYGMVVEAEWYNGDFNDDGVVDLDDLTLLGTFYGTSLRSSPTPVAAPEPTTLALLTAGGFLALRRRRR